MYLRLYPLIQMSYQQLQGLSQARTDSRLPDQQQLQRYYRQRSIGHGNPRRTRHIGRIAKGRNLLRQIADVLHVQVHQLLAGDQGRWHQYLVPGVFTGNQHRQGTDADGPRHLRVDRCGSGPGATRFFHDLDIRSGNIGAVDLHFRTEPGFVDGDFRAFGELVKRREDHADPRVGAQHGAGLVGHRIGNRWIEGTEASLLDDARIRRLDLAPDFVTALHRGKAADIDIPGIETRAVILQRLIQRQARQGMVILLDLGHLRAVQVDVERHHLDALGDGLVYRVLEGFRQPQLDDDAVDTEIDGLLDHLPLAGGLLPGIEHPQGRAQGLGLFLHAAQIGFGEVTGEQIAHQRDLHLALVERRGGLRQRLGVGGQDQPGQQHACQAVTNKTLD